MTVLGRWRDASVNPILQVWCASIRGVVLGGWLAAALAPAHAATFDRTLFVNPLSRPGSITVGTTIEVMKLEGAGVRFEWSLPTLDTGRRPWQFRLGTRSFSCADDFATPIGGAAAPISGSSGHFDLMVAAYPADASYYVRLCLPLGSGEYHATNLVEIRLVRPIIEARPPGVPLPGSPQITSTLAATPVRPRYMIGVTGLYFGERPGRLLLQLGSSLRELTDLEWRPCALMGRIHPITVEDGGPCAIAGRIPFIEAVADGPAALIVERADGTRSQAWPVNFVATRQVIAVPADQFIVDSCSNEADSNHCYPGYVDPYSRDVPSFEASHRSYFVVAAGGESGFDQYSIPLANGWRFHHLEYILGDRVTPPGVSYIDRDSTRPRFRVSWRNPGGFNVHIIYGFRAYIIGPALVPYR